VAKILRVAVGTGLDFLLLPLFQKHHGNGGIGVVLAFAVSEFCVCSGVMIVLRPGDARTGMELDAARGLVAAGATLRGVAARSSVWGAVTSQIADVGAPAGPRSADRPPHSPI